MGCTTSSMVVPSSHPVHIPSKSSSQKARSTNPKPTKSSSNAPREETIDWIPKENRVRNIHAILELHEQIGRGSTCTVHRAAWRMEDEEEPNTDSFSSNSSISTGGSITGQFCAVKKLARPKRTNVARREIDILCALHHPNILRFEDVFADQENVWMVMEFCAGGCLIEYLREPHRHGAEETFARSIMRQLMNAVEHLHSKGIVHRDIKPDNIAFADASKTRIVLIDFGTTQFVDDFPETIRDWAGTPAFMSPEMFDERRPSDLKGIDMWAIGVTCFVTLTGFFPFYGNDLKMIRRQVDRKKLAFPKGTSISRESRDFVRKLIERNKCGRMTAGAALSHAWIREE